MSLRLRESFQHRHGIGSVQQRGGSADTDQEEVEDEMNAVAVAAMMEAEAAAAAAAAAAIGLSTQSLPSSQQEDATAAAVARKVGVADLREDDQAVAGPVSEGIALANTMPDNEQFGIIHGTMEKDGVVTAAGGGAYPFVVTGGGACGENDEDTGFREEERGTALDSVAHVDGVNEDPEPHVESIQMNSFIAHLAQDETYPMIYFSYCMTDEQKDELQSQVEKYNELQQRHMMFMIQEAQAQVAEMEVQRRKKREEMMNNGVNGNADVARRENGAVASTTDSMRVDSSHQQDQKQGQEQQQQQQQQQQQGQQQQQQRQQQEKEEVPLPPAQQQPQEQPSPPHQEKLEQPLSTPRQEQGALTSNGMSTGTPETTTAPRDVVGGGTIGAAAIAVVAASNATTVNGTGGGNTVHTHTHMARPPVRTGRWAPTIEQLSILERNFQPNLGTPGKPKIKALLDEMSVHGPISEKNIYNWFQNRRARSKKRQVHDKTDACSADQKKLKNNIFDISYFLSNGIKTDKKFTTIDTKPPLIQPSLLPQTLLPPKPPPLAGVVVAPPAHPLPLVSTAASTLPTVKQEEE